MNHLRVASRHIDGAHLVVEKWSDIHLRVEGRAVEVNDGRLRVLQLGILVISLCFRA
jgi:hypothetical protein